MKIAFMGTPALAVPCLDALAKHHEIAVVVSQPDKIGGRGHKLIAAPVKTRSLEMGVPVMQPRRARDEEFIEELRAYAPDAIAVVAFGQILPQAILDMAAAWLRQLALFFAPALARRRAGAIRDLEWRQNNWRHHAMDGGEIGCGRHHSTSRSAD